MVVLQDGPKVATLLPIFGATYRLESPNSSRECLSLDANNLCWSFQLIKTLVNH